MKIGLQCNKEYQSFYQFILIFSTGNNTDSLDGRNEIDLNTDLSK